MKDNTNLGIWVLVLIGLSISVVGCSKRNSLNNADEASTSQLSVSGKVSLGPVENANVKVYRIEQDGSRGELLGQGTTDENGEYTVNLKEKSGVVEIVATGGKYEEEASEGIIERPSDEELRSVVDDISKKKIVAITPLTDLASERAANLKKQGLSIADAAKLATHEIQEAAGVSDITAPPIDPRKPASEQGADEERKKYALVLAGLSQLAKEKGAKSHQIAKALAEDFKEDGKFDGSSSGNPIYIDKSVSIISENEWKDKLPAAMTSFVNGQRNTAGFSEQEIPSTATEVKENLPVAKPPPPTIRPTPSALAMNAMMKFPENTCVPIVVRTVDKAGSTVPTPVAVPLAFGLADKLKVYLKPDCSGDSITASKMDANTAVHYVFVKAEAPGTFELTVSDLAEASPLLSAKVELTSVSKSSGTPITVPNPSINPSKLFLRAPPKIAAGFCVLAQVGFMNDEDIPVPAGADASGNERVINLSFSQKIEIFSNSICDDTSKISSIKIPKSQIIGPFFIKSSVAASDKLSAFHPDFPKRELNVEAVEVSTAPPSPPAGAKLELAGQDSLYVGKCYPFIIRHLTKDMSPAPVSGPPLKLSLSSKSGTALFFTDQACTQTATGNDGITSVSIPTGWAHAPVFVQMKTDGAETLKAFAPESTISLIAAEKSLSVFPVGGTIPLGAKLVFTAPPSFPIGFCTGVRVEHRSSSGSLVPVPTKISIALSSSEVGIFSDPNCITPITMTEIPAGQAARVFFIRTKTPSTAISIRGKVEGSNLEDALISNLTAN